MSKKSKTTAIRFDFGSNQIKIRESSNAIRWNPKLAITWMREVQNILVSPLEQKLWNDTAKSINNTLTSIEAQKYYNPKEFWFIINDNVKIHVPAERLEYIDIPYTQEDYVAMKNIGMVV